jgi:exo-beta-1,3-glucanase (GH17 family)
MSVSSQLVVIPQKQLICSLLEQCGFVDCSLLTTRFNALSSILHSNPKGKLVTRVVQVGTEPLFDDVITPAALAAQVISIKQNLSDIGIPVTVSEMAYGYQIRPGSQAVLDAIDSINIHMLPFFAGDATTGVYQVPDIQIAPRPLNASD